MNIRNRIALTMFLVNTLFIKLFLAKELLGFEWFGWLVWLNWLIWFNWLVWFNWFDWFRCAYLLPNPLS